MTPEQKLVLEGVIEAIKPIIIHHGDCVGVDADAHFIANERGVPLVVHPPLNKRYRAYCNSDTINAPREYLERNREICKESDFLIGFPKEYKPRTRSGTWYTIRYALNWPATKHVGVVFPDGSVRSDHDLINLLYGNS